MSGWTKHNLESKLPGEISVTSDMQMTLSLWQKAKNWKASWWKWVKESEQAGLKLYIQKTKIIASGPITSLQIDGETMKTVRDVFFSSNRCESWTIKKAEHWRIDAFELWCWRLFRVPWLQVDQTSQSKGKSILNIHQKDWCWNWSIHTLATWCKELTHWKRPWCWERLKTGGKGDDRGWAVWMASLTWCTWVWASPRAWWWTGKPGILQSTKLQRVGHVLATELNSKWNNPLTISIWNMLFIDPVYKNILHMHLLSEMAQSLSVECAFLAIWINAFLITLSLNSFCNEISSTRASLGPKTRYHGFLLGLSPIDMGSSPRLGFG